MVSVRTGWDQTCPHSPAACIPLLLPIQALAQQSLSAKRGAKRGPKRATKANARSKACRSFRTPPSPPHTPNPARLHRASSGRAAWLVQHAHISSPLPVSLPRPDAGARLLSADCTLPHRRPARAWRRDAQPRRRLALGEIAADHEAALCAARLPPSPILSPLPAHPTATPHPPSPHPPSPHPTLLLLTPLSFFPTRRTYAILPPHPTPPHPPSAWQHAACRSVVSHRRSARAPRPTWLTWR